MKFIRFITPVALLLLNACATNSTYTMPLSLAMSPEAEGKSGASILLGLHQEQEIDITSSIATRPVATSGHEVKTNGVLGGLISMGATEELDVGIHLSGSIPFFFAKYQLIGASSAVANRGNLSASLLGAVGPTMSMTETDYEVFSSSTGTISREASAVYQLGILTGYRLAAETVVIIGVQYSSRTLEGQQTLNSGTTQSFRDEPQSYGVHTGMRMAMGRGENWVLQPQIYRSFLKTFGKTTARYSFSVDLGYQF